MNCRIDIHGGKCCIHDHRELINAPFQQPLKPCSDDIKGQVKHKHHNTDKTGNGGIFTGKNPVNLLTADTFPALLGFYDRLFTEPLNKIKSHICNCSAAVKSTLLFHLTYNMLQHFCFIFIQLKLIKNQVIAFNDLRCGKPDRNSCCLCMILNQMNHGMNTAMHRSIMIFFVTKILFHRAFLIFCNVNGMPDQLVHPFILCRRNRNHRHSQHCFHGIHINRSLITDHFIHHVKCDNHRNIHLQKLHGKVQIPFNISCIHNIDDCAWLFIQYKISRYNLLTAIGRHRINSRKIGHFCILISPDHTILTVHGNSREIADMLFCPG